jgi:hypothetical protein
MGKKGASLKRAPINLYIDGICGYGVKTNLDIQTPQLGADDLLKKSFQPDLK